MRLVLKHSEGKLPFFGILFDSQSAAEDAIVYSSDLNLTLVVQANYGRLFVSLRGKNDEELKYYRGIEYNTAELKMWKSYVHLGVNFGHCFMQDQKLCCAKQKDGHYYVVKLKSFIDY